MKLQRGRWSRSCSFLLWQRAAMAVFPSFASRTILYKTSKHITRLRDNKCQMEPIYCAVLTWNLIKTWHSRGLLSRFQFEVVEANSTQLEKLNFLQFACVHRTVRTSSIHVYFLTFLYFTLVCVYYSERLPTVFPTFKIIRICYIWRKISYKII